MNRLYYSFAIFFSVLYMVVTFFQSILYFQLGVQTYSLESFPLWYVCSNIIGLIGGLVLLKYYRHKKYEFTFWSALVSTLAVVFQFFIVFAILMGVRELVTYYYMVVLVVLATGIVNSISLIFSDAGKRPLLKTTGIITLILGLVITSAIIWSITPPDVKKNATAEKIHQWASLVGSLVPILLIMNFSEERKLLRKESVNSPPPPMRSLESVMIATGLLAFVATLILGANVSRETVSKLSWEKHLEVKAKEWSQLFEARSFSDAKGKTLEYQLLKPLDHDPQKKYPVVVCLPYGGGVEGCPPAQLLLTDSYRKKYPSFLFVPTCPPGEGWGGIPNYPTIDTLVFESLLALGKEFPEIDAKRFYVTGVSRGGYGSWHFIATAPEMFAAAIPVCGGGDPKLAPKIADVAVWAFHGEDDRNVPVSGSRDMIAAIKSAGGEPKYTEFKDAGHNIWDQVKSTAGLMDWLFEQQRD
jgi:hypothetical protein